jgi:hypothetical protein
MASQNEWDVYDYEVWMFTEMLGMCNDAHKKWFNQNIQNAFTESLVLHTRNLADILLSQRLPDDIKLNEMLQGFNSPLIARLRELYGKWNEEKSPCWTINKMLVHSTKERADRFNYSDKLNEIVPTMIALMAEVRAERDKPPAAGKPESAENAPPPAPEHVP